MPEFTSLPPELLVDILELAHEPFVHTNVCWIFNQIATPILYRRVSLYFSYKAHGIHLFLRTIISRPSLGNCVQCLFADPYDPVGEPGYIPPSRGNLPGFVAEAALHGLSTEIQQAIGDGSIPAMLFLLLCYLPRLQTFQLPLPERGRDSGIFYQQMSITSSLPSGLRSVRSVRLSPWATNKLTWEMIVPFLRLPSLQRFLCINGIANLGLNEISHPLPGSSRIEHIEFQSCEIHNDMLGTLVRSSRLLRTFVYKVRSSTIIHPPPLGDALRQYALSTLECLEVTHSDNLSIDSFGPLSGFTRLAHIKISLSLLLGGPNGETTNTIACRLSTTLPVSLISLYLLIDSAWKSVSIGPVAEWFVKNRHERLNYLRNIAICGYIEDSERQRLESLCMAEGLEILPRYWNTGILFGCV